MIIQNGFPLYSLLVQSFFSSAQMDSDLMPPSLSEGNLQFHEVSEPWLQAASANRCDPQVQQLFKGQTRTNQSQGGFKPF